MVIKNDIQHAAELALWELQTLLDQHSIEVSVHPLSKEQALGIEFRKTGLDWRWWFKERHPYIKNRFTLAISSQGRPPIVIGAAVYSHDIQAKQVVIYMLEHFKAVYPDSGIEKRMAWCVFFAAYAFAVTVGATSFKIYEPIQSVVPYYEYWGFVKDGKHMIINELVLYDKLKKVSANQGKHDFEWEE